MQKVRNYLSGAFLAGLVLLLPAVILGIFFRWLFNLITRQIDPLTSVVAMHTGMPEVVSDVIVVAIMAVIVLLIGIFARTTVGGYLHALVDRYLLRVAPGYQMIKEIVHQLFGDRSQSPFASGSVALVCLYGRELDIQVTAIVTSRHPDGRFTVFVPTGPNPTTGFIYHVPPELVELRPEIKVDAAFRSIIACGAGSANLFAGAPANVGGTPGNGPVPRPGEDGR